MVNTGDTRFIDPCAVLTLRQLHNLKRMLQFVRLAS
jgi:hypothetical protein